MEKKRSLWITLLGVFITIFALWRVLIFTSGLMLLFFIDSSFKPDLLFFIQGILSMLIGGCLLVGGIAFLRLREWGRKLTTFSLVAYILLKSTLLIIRCCVFFVKIHFSLRGLFENFYVIAMSVEPFYAVVFFEVIALFLVTRPKVKEQFK